MVPTVSDPELPRDLIERVLQLPPGSRVKLGNLLLDSVEPEETEEEVAAFREEIRRRTERVLDGTEPLDWRESLARVEADFRKKYPQ